MNGESSPDAVDGFEVDEAVDDDSLVEVATVTDGEVTVTTRRLGPEGLTGEELDRLDEVNEAAGVRTSPPQLPESSRNGLGGEDVTPENRSSGGRIWSRIGAVLSRSRLVELDLAVRDGDASGDRTPETEQ